MRRSLALAAGIVGCLALTSCTAPISYGVRLNADGTVDYANCDGRLAEYEVDYRVDDSDTYAEWSLVPGVGASLPGRVIEYGVIPDGFSGVALPPPAEWKTVTVGGGFFARDELVVDDWVWEDYNFDFIPGQPCMDVD